MKKEIIFVTGMSGAGKSVASKSLEDLGYYCIDNIPSESIEISIEKISISEIDKIAFITDLRSLGFNEKFKEVFLKIKKDVKYNVKLVFLDADNNTLIGRYKKSRRKHPISKESSPLLSIEEERKKLEEIKKISDFKIDTSLYKDKDLFDKFNKLFSLNDDNFKINLMSFGFKYGVPIDSDLVFDVRFLKNPYYDLDLRPKNGLDKSVQDYVFNEKETQEFFAKLVDFLSYTIPKYKVEGKQQLVISIGCTGGKHRSISTVEKLNDILKDHYNIHNIHRDIGRE